MATATVDTEIVVKTDKLLAKLKEIPGVSEKEFKRMAAAISKAYAKAEKDAEKASNKAKQEAEKARREAERGLEALGKALAERFGGPISKLADLSTTTAGAVGAVGAAGFAAVAGIGALSMGAKGLADAALKARERLEEMGRQAEIPPEALAALDEYKMASAELQAELDILTVTLGSDMATSLSTVIDLTKSAAAQSRDFAASLDKTSISAVAAQSSWDAAHRVANLLSLGILGVVESAAENVQAVHEINAANRAAIAAEKELGATVEAGILIASEGAKKDVETARAKDEAAAASRRKAEATKAEADAERMAAAVRKQLIEDNERAIESEEKAVDAALMHGITVRRMDLALQDLSRTQAQVASDSADLSDALDVAAEKWSSAGFAAQIYAQMAANAINSQAADSIVGGFQNIIDIQQQQNDAAISQLQEQMDKRREVIKEQADAEKDRVDHLVEIGALTGKEGAEQKRLINEEAKLRRQRLRERTKDERDALKKSFNAGKNLQRAAAVIDSFRAAVALIPAFAFLGPGAPIAAAAVAATGLAASVAQINSQKPPEFPMGRTPDHPITANVQRDEGILSRRGVASAGGASEVARLNEGQRGGGRKVVVMLGRRELASAWEDVNGKARPDSRMGRVDPWGGR